MTRTFYALLLISQMLVIGCGGSSDSEIAIGKPSKIPTPSPMSVEEWKSLPNSTEKFDPEMLERMRRHNPTLKSNKAWKKFMNEVVVPEMEKDKPQEPI